MTDAKGHPQDGLEADLFEGSGSEAGMTVKQRAGTTVKRQAGTTCEDRGPSLKELLLAPEARTERLTPPRRRWRRRKPWSPDEG